MRECSKKLYTAELSRISFLYLTASLHFVVQVRMYQVYLGHKLKRGTGLCHHLMESLHVLFIPSMVPLLLEQRFVCGFKQILTMYDVIEPDTNIDTFLIQHSSLLMISQRLETCKGTD